MPDASKTSERGGADSGPVTLRHLWQLPVLALGGALFVAGAFAVVRRQPVYDLNGALGDAARLVERQSYREALETLNGEVRAGIDEHGATPEQLARFHLMRADTLWLLQRHEEASTPANHQTIAEEYAKAESQGGSAVPARSAARLAGSLLALGRVDPALERIRALPDELARERAELLRAAVEVVMSQRLREAARGALPSLLAEYRDQPALTEADRLWAAAAEARLRISAGYSDRAIEPLLRTLQRLPNPESPDAAELLVLLGRAYYETGRFQESQERLDRAERLLADASPVRAEAAITLGRIAQSRGELEEARQRYLSVLGPLGDPGARAGALLGLAETEAALGDSRASLEAYGGVVRALHAGEAGEIDHERVEHSLQQRADDRLAASDFETAIEFAMLAESLRPESEPPVWTVLVRAKANRLIAERQAEPAQVDDGRIDWTRLDPVTREQVRRRFSDAADAYRRHARRLAGEDDQAYADSLFSAGDAFDRAGEPDLAIAAFSEYAVGRPNDPRNAAARFRLAGAHEARGDYEIAGEIYRELVAENPQSGEGVRSVVPLVRSILADGDGSNDQEAEPLLLRVVEGGLSPSAPDFRHALHELGRLYYERGRHADAIARLTEHRERFPDSDDAFRVRTQLADALRQSARSIEDELREAMPRRKREELEALRRERLEQALAIYDEIAREAIASPGGRITELEAIAQRNAFFYRGDCAFDLADYEAAIEHYDAAAHRYAGDPTSLVAMIQIVNAYAMMNRWDEARTANERARQRFREIPESAFDRPDLPMERRHWERWLESTAALADRLTDDGS